MAINTPHHHRNPFVPFFVLLAPILGVVLYLSAGALASEPINESNQVTILNVAVVNPGALEAVWTLPTPAHASSRFVYRPVLAQLFRLQYQTWGDSPSSYHSVSLFLFGGVLLMFIVLLGRLTAHPWARVAAVFTLALHPLFTQAVANIAAQGVLLSLLASLGACYVYLLHRDGVLSLPQAAPAAALLGFIAMGSCEMGLLLPVWLGAVALLAPPPAAPALATPARKPKKKSENAPGSSLQPPTSGVVTRFLAFGLPLLIAAGLYLFMRWRALSMLTPSRLEGVGLADAPRVLGAYLARLLWPVKPTYFYSVADSWHLTPVAPVAWALVAGLLAALAWAWRRLPLLALGLIFLLTPLAALAHIFPLTFFMSEQHLPFALAGLALIAGAVAGRLASPYWSPWPERGRDRVLAALLCLVWVAMTGQTWARTREWRKVETLWLAEAARHPKNAAPMVELVEAYVRAGKPEAARNKSREARAKATPVELARLIELEAATALMQRDDLRLKQLIDEALAEKRPARPEHLERIAVFAAQRDFKQEYARLLEKQVEFYPNSFEAHYGLAKLELDAKNLDKAIKWGSKAIQYAPDATSRAMGLERYGIILAQAGRLPEAEGELNQALAIDKTLYEAHIHLARIYWGKKDYEKAKGVIRACYLNAVHRVSSRRDLVELYTGVLEDEGRPKEAVAWMESQLNQFPNDVRMQVWGARFLIEYSQFDRAQKALESIAILPEARGSRVDILIAMGLIRQRRDRDNAEAARLWREAVKMDPLNVEAKRLLSSVE